MQECFQTIDATVQTIFGSRLAHEHSDIGRLLQIIRSATRRGADFAERSRMGHHFSQGAGPSTR